MANNFAQPPSALNLARQVQYNRLSRQRLLVEALAADNERRGRAQILHHDVIQDLAGVSFALSSLGEHIDAKNGPAVERLAEIVRRDVTLLLAIRPELCPRLDLTSVSKSLAELGNPLLGAGGLVKVEVNPAMGKTTATGAVRASRQGLYNARKNMPHRGRSGNGSRARTLALFSRSSTTATALIRQPNLEPAISASS